MKRGKKIKSSDTFFILIRYLIALGIIFALPVIYRIAKPLTIIPSVYLLDLFYSIQRFHDYIIIDTSTFIDIIPACIAGSAYLLLLIINLLTPMKLKKRIYTLLFSLLLLLALNILRIVIVSVWYHEKIIFFEFTHAVLWYVLSTVFVVVIWIFTIRVYTIKEIPVYTDIKRFL
ncbi:MAG: hypothetical protein RL557_554 [archaeon]|jgi:exosortase/archaeosortase family protein